MKELLEKYEGITIGINCFDPIETDLLELFTVKSNYFGVMNRSTGYKSYFPYNAILGIHEQKYFTTKTHYIKFPLLIKIDHLIVYKGGSRVGFGVIF
ncbi:MAG: hypothetical protein LBM96_01175 [Methanobrevibacter sp.]|jgi:hypothetical protein|nr:hypothetical protein [Candidatus Methanoflexus mossambicus]